MKKIILIGTIILLSIAAIIAFATYHEDQKEVEALKAPVNERDYLPYMEQLKGVCAISIETMGEDNPFYEASKKQQREVDLVIDSLKQERRNGIINRDRNYLPYLKSLHDIYKFVNENPPSNQGYDENLQRWQFTLKKVMDSVVAEQKGDSYR